MTRQATLGRPARTELTPPLTLSITVLFLLFHATTSFLHVQSGLLARPFHTMQTDPSGRNLAMQLQGSERGSEASNEEQLREEARRLLEQAQVLRQQADKSSEILVSSREDTSVPRTASASISSPWTLPMSKDKRDHESVEYRLYVDIGREPGTWMDPRWGASGRRVGFTVDVRFCQSSLLDCTIKTPQEQEALEAITTSSNGKSEPKILQSARYARLRSGFDCMECRGGAYRIDRMKAGADGTVKFCILVEGTDPLSGSYGDVSVPQGLLFFCLPAFQRKLNLFSTKLGPVTIRQKGWNTGWWREESRIVGVFRAVSLAAAREKDGF